MEDYKKALITVSKSCKRHAIEWGEKMFISDAIALNKLKKLVLKATPIKQTDEHRCPKCNAYIWVNDNLVKVNYCWHCGQRLE